MLACQQEKQFRQPGGSRLLWSVPAEISCRSWVMSCLWSQGDRKIKMVWLHCLVHSWNINDNDIMEIEPLLLFSSVIIRS